MTTFASAHPRRIDDYTPAAIKRRAERSAAMPKPSPPPVDDAEPGPKAVPAGLKVPKTLAACADLYYTIREQRRASQKATAALEEHERWLADHLIRSLPRQDAGGIAGKIARVTRVVKQVPQAKDWAKIHAYIKKNNAFELLQRRLSDVAVKERWDAGKQIPGVESFTTVTLSVNKL